MILIKWLLSALALWLVSLVVPGIRFSSTGTLLIAAIVFGLINALIRPLILLLTLPVNILTLGLFTLVINAFLLWLASILVPGFSVNNFATAFWGALVYAIIISLINLVFNY